MSFNNIVDLVIVVLIAWLAYLQFGPVKGLQSLRADEFRERIAERSANRILIDVREGHEFSGGHIPGAKNIPLSVLSRRLNEIPEGADVYLYCRSGMRSKRAARMLRGKGYASLAHLQGGISAWRGKLS